MYFIGLVWLISVVVGAIIGAVTNLIAIAMLFRPYHAIKLFGWKLPFTPGIIPKRHEEIAYQLGQVVEKHLVTPEALREYLASEAIQQQMRDWLNEAFQLVIELAKRQKLGVLADKVGIKTEDLADLAVNELLRRARKLVNSPDGERIIYHMIDTAVEKQGPFTRMIDVLLPKERIAIKLQGLVYDGLGNKTLYQWLYHYIYSEIKKMEAKEVSELITADLEEKWAGQVPALLQQILQRLNKEIMNLATRVKLSKIVEKQILSFPLPRLEELIREVANRELRMITLFGGLLGGLLGGIQALIFTAFQSF